MDTGLENPKNTRKKFKIATSLENPKVTVKLFTS